MARARPAHGPGLPYAPGHPAHEGTPAHPGFLLATPEKVNTFILLEAKQAPDPGVADLLVALGVDPEERSTAWHRRFGLPDLKRATSVERTDASQATKLLRAELGFIGRPEQGDQPDPVGLDEARDGMDAEFEELEIDRELARWADDGGAT